MEYELIQAGDVDTLSKTVSEKLSKGFDLYGNPFATAFVKKNQNGTDKEQVTYFQAVIKAKTSGVVITEESTSVGIGF